jgi:hypothetical protein
VRRSDVDVGPAFTWELSGTTAVRLPLERPLDLEHPILYLRSVLPTVPALPPKLHTQIGCQASVYLHMNQQTQRQSRAEDIFAS